MNKKKVYSEKIITELQEKIKKYHLIVSERSEMEATSSQSIEELLESDDEYEGLCVQEVDARDEIYDVLLDGIYAPLVLSKKANKDIGEFIRSMTLSPHQIERHLTFLLEQHREGMKNRLSKIRPISVCGHPRSGVDYLYKQAVMCHVFGIFEASCALCRAICESIVINYNCEKISKLLLHHEKKAIWGILKKDIEPKAPGSIKLYDEINRRANMALHSEAKISSKESLTVIKLLQKFVKKISQSKKF